MFIMEQEEYKREGIEWTFIDFGLDLQPTIDLLEKPVGVLALIDEECWFPKASDKTLIEKLIQQHSNHPKFKKPEALRKNNISFTLRHYAGDVDYSCDQWLMKNMDPLNENVVQLLQESNDTFIKNIWKDAEIIGMSNMASAESQFGARTRKGMFRTVGGLYKEQLSKLMSTLNNTNPNFVRCIIPNHEKKAGKIDAHLVLDQLRCNGVLEGIRICRQGFPNRILFQEFRQRYELLTPNVIPRGFMDGKEACRRMLQSLELDTNLFRIGQSKIFFRAGVLAHLEEERDLRLTDLIIQFQAYCRGCLARRQLNKRQQQLNALKVIQRNCAAYLKLRNWQWWRLFTKVKPILQATKHEEVLQNMETKYKDASRMLENAERDVVTMRDQVAQLVEEKNILSEKLRQEAETAQEADEERLRLQERKKELEDMLTDMGARCEEEVQRIEEISKEKNKLQNVLKDLEDQLEDEEQMRQKIQMEKMQMETKMKKFEETSAMLEDSLQRTSKEKKVLEERVNDLTQSLGEEEEKGKGLSRLKAKYENTIKDLEERLRKEQELRVNLEKAKRRLEQELVEVKDQLNEKMEQLTELQTQLSKRENELQSALTHIEEEVTGRTSMQRQIRDLEAQITEAQEDLKEEREKRKRVDLQRKELENDFEKMKNELEETQDHNQAVHDMQRKRDDELKKSIQVLEEEKKSSERTICSLKQKNLQQVEQLNEQLDQIRKQKASSEKSRQTLEIENNDLMSENKLLQNARAEADRKRKIAESTSADCQLRLKEAESERIDAQDKIMKLYNEVEGYSQQLTAAESSLTQAKKQVEFYEGQLRDNQTNLEDETRGKLAFQNQLRTMERECDNLNDQIAELEDIKGKYETKLNEKERKEADLKRQLEAETVSSKTAEEAKTKLSRDLIEMEDRISAIQLDLDKALKSRNKYQTELEDALNEISQSRNQLANMDRKARKFDQGIAEERAIREKIVTERDQIASECRDKETKILTLQREVEDITVRMNELDRLNKRQKVELDEIISSKDAKGQNAAELERNNRLLSDKIQELEQLLIEREDEVLLAEDAKSRIEVMYNALKQQMERDRAAKEESEEDARRALLRQLRDLENHLDEERKQKNSILAEKKKLEFQLNSKDEALENAMRGRDETNKALKRASATAQQYQKDAQEAFQQRDEFVNKLRQLERRVKQLEGELQQNNDICQNMERLKKAAEAERDEALSDLSTSESFKNTLLDEKKKLEGRLNELEEELDEEQGNSEILEEK